jgi:hypothetical protein
LLRGVKVAAQSQVGLSLSRVRAAKLDGNAALTMPGTLAHLNLQYYRKQAKALLKASKSGDANATQRLQRYMSKQTAMPALNDAQLTIDRE